MKHVMICILGTVLLAGAWSGAAAQRVYRCELADGSTVFSDLPCLSDTGRAETVDATPHQGHRPAPEPSTLAYRMPDTESKSTASGQAERSRYRGLSRNERLSLERQRKRLLSGLKRRNVDSARRTSMMRKLREVDHRLGIDASDVADMPYHDREVYEDHPIFR